MIRRHDFNSAWWGADVGIVDDAQFFALPDRERAEQLSPFHWVEFHAKDTPPSLALHRAGFVFADAHLQFRIALGAVTLSSSAAAIELMSASETGFAVVAPDIKIFERERFFLLPGVDATRVAERYALESAKLLAASPSTCLCARYNGEVQGWFLSMPGVAGIDLTLAMLSASAVVSGHLLYAAALARYARDGFKVGMAGYSYRNTAVANLYSNLGARVTSVRETWMWKRDGG